MPRIRFKPGNLPRHASRCRDDFEFSDVQPRVRVHADRGVDQQLTTLAPFAMSRTPAPLSRHPAWLLILRDAFGHQVFLLEARQQGRTTGLLPLAAVRSRLFGRFLVSLPYLNSNGIIAESPAAAEALLSQAVKLADELGVRYLELRHETPTMHPAINAQLSSKVHMRLRLPGSPEELWKQLDAKVRNQVRKAEKQSFELAWGGAELLDPFYAVLSENMRDLGTPVYGKNLFLRILHEFPGDAELCVLHLQKKPVAAALLLHGSGTTEVPTASSLRAYNSSCANMLMYRHLLDRAILRGQSLFDFGRSTIDSGTHRFKKQWGAEAFPAHWQYHVRVGNVGEMRPDHPRYAWMIKLWQHLPVRWTQIIGPRIVRGIP